MFANLVLSLFLKQKIRVQENISDEKICADVENYFEEYVGDSTANCYGNEVPDVVNEHWVYSRENFLWALSQVYLLAIQRIWSN